MSLGGRITLLLAVTAGVMLAAFAAYAWPERPTGIHFMDDTLKMQTERYQDVETALNKLSFAVNCDVRVGILKSMEGKDSGEAGAELVKAWKMGTGFGNDAYILLVIFPNDRDMRLEYGAKLNGTGMDTLSQDIVNTVIAPRLKEGDYAGGIIAGATAFQQAIEGDYRPPDNSSSNLPAGAAGGGGGAVALAIIMTLLRMFGRYNGSSLGSGGSSTFSSSGGSRSSAYKGGGGGCSGKW